MRPGECSSSKHIPSYTVVAPEALPLPWTVSYYILPAKPVSTTTTYIGCLAGAYLKYSTGTLMVVPPPLPPLSNSHLAPSSIFFASRSMTEVNSEDFVARGENVRVCVRECFFVERDRRHAKAAQLLLPLEKIPCFFLFLQISLLCLSVYLYVCPCAPSYFLLFEADLKRARKKT